MESLEVTIDWNSKEHPQNEVNQKSCLNLRNF